MRPILGFLLAAALAVPAAAQSCSDLAIRGTGQPGTPLVFAVRGATADAPTVLVLGPNAGSTTIRFGALRSLTIGLDRPFIVLPLGRTDANGDLVRTVTVPANVARQHALHGQAVTVDGRRRARTFCESDVEAFTIG